MRDGGDGEGPGEVGGGHDGAADEDERAGEGGEGGSGAGGEVDAVEGDDGAALAEQVLGDVEADEAGGAGDECDHGGMGPHGGEGRNPGVGQAFAG